MENPKFSLNALLIVVLIISVIAFFVTVTVTNAADPTAINEFYPIEGTDLGIKNSNLETNGIYRGNENSGTLMAEGNFGFDWGTSLVGDCLILNEYAVTSVGMLVSEVVKIDISTFDKEVLLKDAMIRGKCASGELVCLGGFLLPTSFPKTNSLLRFYSMTSKDLKTEGNSNLVLFLDPATGQTLYSLRDDQIMEKTFSEKYLDRTLDEIREEAAA